MADDEEVGADLEDLGEPVLELLELTEQPSGGFLSRLLSTLRRRSLGSHIAALSFTAFGEVILEFLTMIYSLFESDRTDGEG